MGCAFCEESNAPFYIRVGYASGVSYFLCEDCYTTISWQLSPAAQYTAPCRVCDGKKHPLHGHPIADFIRHDRESHAVPRILARWDLWAYEDGFQLREDDVSTTTFQREKQDRHHNLMDVWMYIGWKMGLISEDPRCTHTRPHDAITMDGDYQKPKEKET